MQFFQLENAVLKSIFETNFGTTSNLPALELSSTINLISFYNVLLHRDKKKQRPHQLSNFWANTMQTGNTGTAGKV
jgi:hypothetical protein